MTLQEIKEHYLRNKTDDGSTAWVKKKEHAHFRESVKKHFSFLSELEGRVEFSLYLTALENNMTEVPSCVVCGSKITKVHKKEFPKTCSRKCNGVYVIESQKEKNLEKYGVEYHSQRKDVRENAEKSFFEKYGVTHPMMLQSVKEKQKAAILDKYGVENVFQSEEIKEKIRKTNKEMYGVENPMQREEIKEKAEATNVVRYGSKNPMQNLDVQSKTASTCMSRYGAVSYIVSDEFKEVVKKRNLEQWGVQHNKQRHIPVDVLEKLDDPVWLKKNYLEYGGLRLSELLGVDGTTVYSRLRKHNIDINPTNTSAAERQIFDFITSLGIYAIQSDRTVLQGKELDIIIPEKKIAIEYNGLYWHSRKYKPDNYHLEKTKEASVNGYRLIHIFEDEWTYRTEQVKEKLKSILGVDARTLVYARKCVVEKINDVGLIGDFYNDNHIQGTTGQSVTFSLTLQGSVVAMMSFTKRTDTQYELVRYATSSRVVGGFSKLLKAASGYLSSIGVVSIVSFADIRYSEGNVYLANGWTHVKNLNPDYQYVVGDRRVRKQNYRRKFLPSKLQTFDPDKTEQENMIENGIYPIYDCGLMKFEYLINKQSQKERA